MGKITLGGKTFTLAMHESRGGDGCTMWWRLRNSPEMEGHLLALKAPHGPTMTQLLCDHCKHRMLDAITGVCRDPFEYEERH